MTEEEIIGLIEEHGIRVTGNRLLVAKCLDRARRPLSLSELEDELETLDKSVIFRTLGAFKEKRLVHSIEDGGDGVRYELCHSHHDDEDDDTHVHFFCESCHRTFCLEEIHIPDVKLPEGYSKTTATFLIKGICPDCKID